MKKKMDRAFLIPSLGLLIVFLIILGFEYTQTFSQNSEKLSPETGNLENANKDSYKDDELTIPPAIVSEGDANEGAGGGSNGGSSESSVSEPLPSDLYTASCGFYFEKYGVCAGSCPDGICVNEGRSCYCKIVK